MATPFVLPQGYTQIPPNYTYKKVGMRGFPLKADKTVLKDLIDRCLNDNLQGTDYSYTPIPTLTTHAPVYLMVSTYGSMASLKIPFSNWGTMDQSEAVFTIPLLRLKKNIPDRISLYSPFSFVDNAWSIITGNMILGFQKGLASFRLPPTIANPYPMEIKALVFPGFSPITPLSWKVWIRIEKKEVIHLTRQPEDLWPLGSVDDLFGPERAFEVNADVLRLLQKGVMDGFFEVVQLLQLRDPVKPECAAYSQIIRFAIRRHHLHNWGLLDFAQIDLRHFASLPVLKTLGLVPEGGWLVPILPYWTTSDFDFEWAP